MAISTWTVPHIHKGNMFGSFWEIIRVVSRAIKKKGEITRNEV